MSFFGKLKSKMGGFAVSKILAVILQKAGNGDFGPKVKAIYWATVGMKTYTAMALAGVAYVLNTLYERGDCAPCADWIGYVVTAAGVLAGLGLVDGAVRIEPPKKSK